VKNRGRFVSGSCAELQRQSRPVSLVEALVGVVVGLLVAIAA
jgi:hypothetical protein